MSSGINALDHLAVMVEDLTAAGNAYERLGFTMTPVSQHSGALAAGAAAEPWGTANRCAMFCQGYLELMGVIDGTLYDNHVPEFLARYPESVTIFVIPRSREILKDRLESRGTDSSNEIEKRLLTSSKEMEQMDIYRHILVNDSLPEAIEELVSIINSYRAGKKDKKDTTNKIDNTAI